MPSPDHPVPEAAADSASLFGGAAPGEAGAPYRVLARKYRPARLDDLIGQEAMVRTLTNAFAGGRIAHAFILTGVRGVGKTTTARIIARGLNCTGVDGKGGPTPNPCGVCDSCIAIADDRHVDVIEMDAASRTGVENIRELIDGVRYRPVSARYKVYILDEVHMLSDKAFNALLKTLEEPPPHVKFIFATTEIRKLPVTVLSRCQRFDLRRLDMETLARHFAGIARAEGMAISEAALALIARAADGSVRDGLSLLDQAMALSTGAIGAEDVRAMLGLADRSQLFDLFDRLTAADAKGALEGFGAMCAAGADPLAVLQDLLELSHWITRLKLVPSIADSPVVSELERVRGTALAERLSMGVLSRIWQMLLKGLTEAQEAPDPLQATEMVLIRLAYAADLPLPADLVRRLDEAEGRAPAAGRPAPSAAGRGSGSREAPSGQTSAVAPSPAPGEEKGRTGPAQSRAPRAMLGNAMQAVATEPAVEADAPPPPPAPQSFREVVDLCAAQREAILRSHLLRDVHLVRFEPGRIELRPAANAPANLANRLGALLSGWTDRRWVVSVSGEPGEPTLAEQDAAAEAQQRSEVMAHPLVQAVLASFPGATLQAVHDRSQPPADPVAPAVRDDSETIPAPEEAGEEEP